MLVVWRLIVNCIFMLVLTYVVLSEDLIDCPNGEQGDEFTEPIICDNDNMTKSKDCSFIFVVDYDDYHVINCLKITNQGNDSVAGTPSIALGGVNWTYIFGDVFSQLGKGVNYSLSVWATQINKSDTTLPPTTTTTLSTTTTTIETTTTEKTTPETTTVTIETTTGGSTKISVNLVLLFCIYGFYVLISGVQVPNH